MEDMQMYDFDEIMTTDPEIADAIKAEMERQNSHIELIASENWVSKAVMAAMGSPLTNKYAEGYQKSFSAASMPTCSLIPEHRQIWQCFSPFFSPEIPIWA